MTALIAQWRGQLRQGYERWFRRFLASRGSITPPFELTYRRIFILPTKFGWVFGGLLVVMTIGGLNFNNNLGLLLTFLLAASAHATLHMAYGNLRGLYLSRIDHKSVFAGENARLHIVFRDQDQNRYRPAIEVSMGDERCSGHLQADQSLRLELPLATERRGWLKPGRIKLHTTYPLGLFIAWSWCESAQEILVYPKPAEDPPPLPKGNEEQGAVLRLQDGEDLVGIRDYQKGDPLPTIAWKASAKHQQLQTKLTAQAAGERLSLEWDQLSGMETETRLSVLCAWVLSAHRSGMEYRMSIPGADFGPARGDSHRDQCLRALALYGEH